MIAELIGAAVLATAPAPQARLVVPAEVVTTDTRVMADVEDVWDAVRDVYHADTRLAPGMVSSVEREGDTRRVTFATGYVVTERIIQIDDAARRVTYAAFGGRATHHLATMQVVADGDSGSRVIWRTEFAPAELLPFIEQNMRQGSEVMKRHLESSIER
jgi:carbon monoxide dehydrogenase subunit G